jgi:hypothetical protein
VIRSGRRVSWVMAAVVGALALSACSSPVKAGSAATVGDETLSESAVAATSEEIDTVLADAQLDATLPPDQVNQSIVALWIDGQITDAIAEAEGVTVTDAEIEKFLEQFDEEARTRITAEGAIPPSQLNAAARTALLRQKLQPELAPDGTPEEQSAALLEAITKTADELDISVNPRFGSWDSCASGGSAGQPCVPGVVPRDDARLSSPAAPDEASEPPSAPAP